MKPKIVNWAYLALGYVLLNNILHVIFVYQIGNFTLLSPALSVFFAIASIVACIGLVKVAPWSRIVACIVIGVHAIGTILTGVHFVIDAGAEISMADMLMSFIIVDFLLLYLVYRLYSSQPLKNYLNPYLRK